MMEQFIHVLNDDEILEEIIRELIKIEEESKKVTRDQVLA